MGSKYWSIIIAVAFAMIGNITVCAADDQSAAIKRIQESLQNATVVWLDGGIQAESSPIDIADYAKESITLINRERVNTGLHELEINDDMMELATVRVKELAEKYSHERPDGTRISTEYYCGEIINRRANTPLIAVESWMSSAKGHKELILSSRYNFVGAGCYQDAEGTVYWVQLFSK